MARFYWSPSEERADFYRRKRQQVTRQRAAADAQKTWKSSNARDLRKAYPWLSPDVIVKMTRDGWDVDRAKDAALILATPMLARQRSLAQDGIGDDEITERGKEKRQNRRQLALRGPSTPAPTAAGPPTFQQRLLGQNLPAPEDSGFLSDIGEGLGDAFGFLQDKDPSGDPLELASRAPGPPGEVFRGFKGVARAGLIAAQAPFEALQGAGRSAPPSLTEAVGVDVGRPAGGTDQWLSGNPTRRFLQDVGSQTTSGQAIKALVEGKRVDTGSGILPDPQSQVGLAQSQATRKAWSIGGQGATLGRFLANTITEPGSTEYSTLSGLVDAINITVGDPANVALGGIGRINQARKNIRPSRLLDDTEIAAGGVRTVVPLDPTEQIINAGGRPWWRRAVQGPTADEFLASPGAVALNAELADITSPAQLWRRLDGVPLVSSQGENLLKSFADADTPEKVTQVWRRALGVDVKGVPKLAAESRMPDVRAFGMVPSRTLDMTDLNQAVPTIEAYLRNGKVPLAARDRIIDNTILNAQGGLLANPDRYDVVRDIGKAIEKQIIDYGATPDFAKESVKVWTDALDAQRAYFTKSAVDETFVPGLLVDGEAVDFATHPYLLTQMLNSAVELPDWKAIKQATTSLKPFFSNPAVKFSTSMIDAYMSKWKLAVLLKPNLPLRVIGEEQARIAASGMTSLFSHPTRAISAMLGGKADHPWLASLLDRVPGVDESTAARLTSNRGSYVASARGQSFGNLLDDPVSAYGQALYDNWADLRPDLRKIQLDEWITDVAKVDERWSEGLIAEINQLRDPVTRAVVDAADPSVVKTAFWDGDLKPVREALARQDYFADLASNRAKADAYIDGAYQYVAEKTRHDSRLTDAIRTGKIEGVALTDRYGTINDDAVKLLDDLKTSPDFGPDTVKWQKTIDATRHAGKIKGANTKLDQVLDVLFFNLMPRESNFASRSPAYRQFYWREEVPGLLPYLDDADQTTILRNAVQARVPRDEVQRLAGIKSVVDDVDPRRLTVTQFDDAAHARALDKTKGLLYDLSEKRQYSDFTRNVFPFLEAWKEVLGRWVRIAGQNPSVVRTVAKDLAGLRAAGVFHVDEETGQEVYSIPGTGWLNEKLIGVHVPLTASVEGLNIASTGLPGVGPVVQIPASYLLPDDPALDKIRGALFPFGDIQKSGDPFSDIVLAGFPVPNWMRRAWSALRDPDSYRDQANATGHIMRYLASTGEYDLDGRDARGEMRRLVEDAKDKAQAFGFIRAAALAAAPSAPIPEWNVKDKQGNLVLAQQLAKDYRKMLTASKGDADKALGKWIEKYGADNLLTLQAFSEPVKGFLPPTTKSLDWLRRNKRLLDEHPEVYGFFAPGSKGEFDINAYARSFDRDEREPLTPEEMVKSSNARLGSYLYRQAEKEVGKNPTEAERAWLGDYRDALTEDYPGYNEHSPDFLKPATLIARVREALTDPTLKRTEAGRAAKRFLTEYDRALEEAKRKGYRTINNQAMKPLRTWLNDYGEALVEDYPDFENLWVYVFSSTTRSN